MLTPLQFLYSCYGKTVGLGTFSCLVMLTYIELDRTHCRKVIRKILVVTTATQNSRQACSRTNRAGISAKSALQARVMLMVEPRANAR
jgi:hypothetical protein